jgi:hypothetical protein
MSPSDTADEDRFVELYKTYIGEPDRRTDIYVGFALFFGGLGVGLVGLFLFAIERAALEGEVFWVREIAFSIGAVGLPLILVAVVVLLPADRRTMYVAAGGLVIVLASIAFFVSVYPSNWNYGRDYSLHGVTIYAVGLITILAATGTALVGYHIERVGGGATSGATAATDADSKSGTESADPAATEAQVQQDIEDAMAGTEISWGGVERVETERLQITPDEDLEGQSLDQSSANVHRSSSIDDELSALQGLKGGEQRTDSGSGVDDQAAALKELREKQQQEENTAPSGVFEQLKSYLDR